MPPLQNTTIVDKSVVYKQSNRCFLGTSKSTPHLFHLYNLLALGRSVLTVVWVPTRGFVLYNNKKY